MNYKAQASLAGEVASSGPSHRLILRQFYPQAPLQLLAELRNFHARHHDELARQHFARIVIIRQLASYTAILAILIPAKSPVGYGIRADELKASQQRISLWHLEFLAQQR